MPRPRVFVLLAASALFSALFLASLAYAQDDSQSLGDAARQARLQKQQKDAQAKDVSAPSSDTPNKDAQSKDGQSKDGQSNDSSSSDGTAKDATPAKAHHVITNEELPSHVGPTWTSASTRPNFEQLFREQLSRAAQFRKCKRECGAMEVPDSGAEEHDRFAGRPNRQPERLHPLRRRKLRFQLRAVERTPERKAGSG